MQKQELTKQLEEQKLHLQQQCKKHFEQSTQLKKMKIDNNKLQQDMQLLHIQNQDQYEHLQIANQQHKDKDEQLKLLNKLNSQKDQQLQESDQQMQEINQMIQKLNQELQAIKDEKEEQVRLKEVQLQQLQQENTELRLQMQRPSWVIKKKKIILGEHELGKGAYGWVKEATFLGCKVAVKCLHDEIILSYNLANFNREMNVAARCRHPNLLQFIGATSIGDGAPFIVTELMYTSLRKVLKHEQLSNNHIIPIMLGIALALNYLHESEPPILHRDVSSANVLLNPLPSNQWFPKLSDFGSLNFLRQSESINAGNPAYAAPEALDPKKGNHTPAMDTFSFGVLLHELCSRTQPMGGLTQNFKHADWKVLESQLVPLIINCIDQEIGKRPKMNTVVTQLKALTRL